MHVRAGITHVAQRRHFECTKVAMFDFHLRGFRGTSSRGIVVVWTQQIELVYRQFLDAVMTAAIGLFAVAINKVRYANIVKLAIGKHRPGMAGTASPFADKN